nr:T-cell receptor delta chain VDJ junction region [mice, liver, gamma delta T cells, 95BLT-3, Peptide Partial, 19 aa] [Mus sp.]
YFCVLIWPVYRRVHATDKL